MDIKEIGQIAALMNEHGLSLFHLTKKDFNIKLKGGSDKEALREMMSLMTAAAPAAIPLTPVPASVPDASAGAAPLPEGEVITSPMAGSYYRKPTPHAADFVEIGSKVSEGQTLCVIEAMKVMNEIKAERNGTILELCLEDGAPVQCGDVLFRIK